MHRKGAPDARVAAVAARQHGVVSIAQLRECGLSDTAVRERLRAGRLHRLHRSVYAVGHRGLSFEGRCMAAALALGPDAALSHRSAAGLWNLLPAADGAVHLSLPGRGGRHRRRGVSVHRPVSLEPSEVTRRCGIPVTTPTRTIADLRRTASPRELRRAIRQAEVLGLPLGGEAPGDNTRSELEHLFLRLCGHAGLPAPAVNVQIGRLIVDFCWEGQRLVVETDGYRYHRGRQAFEDDRARDLELRSLGYDVVRLSYTQVQDQPEQIADLLRKRLKAQTSWR